MQENEKIDSLDKLIDSLDCRRFVGAGDAETSQLSEPQRNVYYNHQMSVCVPAIHGMRTQTGDGWAMNLSQFMNRSGLVPRHVNYSVKWVPVPPPEGADELFFSGEQPTEDNYWVWRECHRFARDIYRRPQIHAILNEYKPELWYHFAHASIHEPHMIAYTPNHEYGKRDRQIRVKVGRYLQQFYGDVLSAEQIRSAVNNCKPFEISWAVTGNEMEYVYVNGPNSCMAGSDDFDSDVHPVHVYEGEFKLAYIETGGDITARCFVHEPTKTWVRSYGDDGPVLSDMLDELGYSKASNWLGAKLKVIRHDSEAYVVPYLDGDAKYIELSGEGQWVIRMSSGEFYCDNTNGLTCAIGTACDDCGENHDDDDIYWSDYHERNIGPCCIDNYRRAIYNSRGHETYVSEDEVIYCESDSEYYLDDERVLSEHNIARCAESDDYYKIDDMVMTIDDEWIANDHAIECGEDGNGDTVYCRPLDIERHWFVHCYNSHVQFLHPDYIPSEIQDEYEQEDEDGNTIQLPMMTVRQFVETSKYKEYQCGFDWTTRRMLERWDNAYITQLSRVAL